MRTESEKPGRGEHLRYLLTAYVFESISEAGRREVEEHLARCAECRAELEELRRTVMKVEDAFAGEADGAAGYSFEARRLERVLAAGGPQGGAAAWLARWRRPLGAAAAAVVVVGLFLSTAPHLVYKKTLPPPGHHDARPEKESTFLGVVLHSYPDGAVQDSPPAISEREEAQRPAEPSVAAAPPAAKPAEAGGAAAPGQSSRQRGVYRQYLRRDNSRMFGGAGGAPGPEVAAAPPEPGQQSADDVPLLYGALQRREAEDGEKSFFRGGSNIPAQEDADRFAVKVEQPLDGSKKQHFYESTRAPKDDLGRDLERANEAGEAREQPEVAAAHSFADKDLKQLKQVADGVTDYQAILPGSDLSDLSNSQQAREALRDTRAEKADQPLDVLSKLRVVKVKDAQGVQAWSFRVEPDGDGGRGKAPIKNLYAILPDLPPPDRSALEGFLRGYLHYKSLDAGLTIDAFAARALDVPPPSVSDEGLGQEGFRKRHGSNPFVDTRRDHFSTFGMDVDTASYTLARGALAAGRLPDPRQVRVEEFVNYFPEEVPASKDQAFSVLCEGGPSPFGEGFDLIKLTVKARDLLPGERKDAVLTFAVDTSGSMHEGERLGLVRAALTALVRGLKPDDRVAIVGFSDHPYLVLPHTPARDADRIAGAIGSLTPRGDTNFEAGLGLAYRVADEVLEPKAVHRVILCSDGVATAGARGAEEILKRVEVFAKRGIYLSCIGFGMGKYNDHLLETLADRGNGNYAYADDAKAAAEVFQKNLPATLQVLAQDAKIQVDFNPEVVSHYRLVGYENRDIADKDFRNDKVDAGEVGPGTAVTVLYEVLRRPGSSGAIGRIHLRYRDTGTGRVDEASYPLSPGVLATRLEDTSDRFRFIACAAETAELLRASYWSRNGSYGRVLEVLQGLGPEFRGRPEWGELAALAARAQELTIAALQAAR